MADPGAAAAWDHVQREGGVRPGQRVTQTRFVIDAESLPGAVAHPERGAGRDPAALSVGTRARLGLPRPRRAGPLERLLRHGRHGPRSTVPTSPSAVGATACSGTTSAPCRSVRGWICGPSARWRRTRACTPRRSAVQLVLSQPDFADAVRQGLKDLARPDLLARNPLLRTRLLADAAAGDRRGRRRARPSPPRAPSRPWPRIRATTSSTGRSSRPTFDGRPPRRGRRPAWGCPSAPTDDTSARASPGSWPGAGSARSTVPTEAHRHLSLNEHD